MNLEKTTDEEKVNVCRLYYRVGFLFLPFAWVINIVWFYKYAFTTPPFQGQAEIKKYVIRSAIGTIIFLIAFIIWNVEFQRNRQSWGAIGDTLSFVIPKGA
ncbi:Gamma-secretase subunit pen-2 [Trichoplax sp. H2]|nr:Gamma-secretase subunit pen-2 [Trichoplax sp. H2]|eukprot:RDD41353.1 Gamma-secretase subunit pen-2 [Trichoplax sp. H2]